MPFKFLKRNTNLHIVFVNSTNSVKCWLEHNSLSSKWNLCQMTCNSLCLPLFPHLPLCTGARARGHTHTHSVSTLAPHSPLLATTQTLTACSFYFINSQCLPFLCPTSSAQRGCPGSLMSHITKFSGFLPSSFYSNSATFDAIDAHGFLGNS